MVTQTSEIAIKALIYLALHHSDEPVPPHAIAARMGCSPTYLGKTMGQLVKAGILRSQRGPQGGMSLAHEPGKITVLMIVEACQGLLIGGYCRAIGDNIGPVCAYHQAMWDVRHSMVEALERWSLADLMKAPCPSGALAGNTECRMAFLYDPKNGPTRTRSSSRTIDARTEEAKTDT